MSMILDGSNGVTFNDASLQGAAASPFVLKNRIINGAMVVDQRNAGASITNNSATFAWGVDRMIVYGTVTSKFTSQQNAGSVTPPVGFSNYLGITSLSTYSVLSTDWFAVSQRIEGFNTADLGWGTANAKTVTLSFQVYSSLTGTFGGVLTNSAQNRSYPFTYSIPVANTWTTISITIAGDTSGTWIGATNGTGIAVVWGLGAGSTYSGTAGAWAGANYYSATGATSVVGTSGATFYITGVQLEQNTSATPFERRLYNQELANCQRYYWQRNSETTFAAVGSGQMNATTVARISLNYPVTMRAIPTVSFTSVGSLIVSQGATDLIPNGATPYANSTGTLVDITTTSAGTNGRGCVVLFNNTSSGSVQATAEL
jgi:hypothetical protein